MLYLVIKAAISGVIVAAVSEIARRYPGWGGLVASLPLTSLLAMLWLFRDTHDAERVAELSVSTIWFFIPSIAAIHCAAGADPFGVRVLAQHGDCRGGHARALRADVLGGAQARPQAMSRSAVVLLSGGLNSMVCAALAREAGFAVTALTVDYGQRHRIELDAARAVASQLADRHIVLPLDLRAFGGSALTSDIDVPEGRSSDGIPSPTCPHATRSS